MNARYQPGGDIFNTLAGQYGQAGAEKVAAADQLSVWERTAAFAEVKNGPRLNDSVVSIFANQIISDPLGAPLESANNQIGNAVIGVFKNPWVLLAIAVFIFLQLGGWNYLRKQLA